MFDDAFPSIFKEDLNIVLNLIPNKTYNNVSIVITDEMISYRLKNNIYIKFPYRMYFLDITDLEYEKLNKVQKELLCCMYTRSCDGYVREKYLKRLLEIDFDEWTIPFIVKLSDEYVIEILEVIYDKLKDRDNCDIKDFCLKNKFVIKRSYSRMISYWNEFYRDREFNFHRYIGRKLFRECFGYDRTFER